MWVVRSRDYNGLLSCILYFVCEVMEEKKKNQQKNYILYPDEIYQYTQKTLE